MKKTLTALFIIFSQLLNAQFASFKFDSLSWTMNGKNISLVNPKMQVDVADTSGLIVLGTSGAYMIGAKFSLAKVATTEGNYYIPGVEFIFKKDNKVVDNLSLSYSILTESDKYTGISSIFIATKSMKLSSLYFICKIDGSKLDYKDNSGLPITKTSVDLNLKLLSLGDSVIMKKQELRMQCGVDFQNMEIGSYNGEPVILYYKLLHAKTGTESTPLFISSISYRNYYGKNDSLSLIEKTTFDKKVTNKFEKSGMMKNGTERPLLKCHYSIYITKNE